MNNIKRRIYLTPNMDYSEHDYIDSESVCYFLNILAGEDIKSRDVLALVRREICRSYVRADHEEGSFGSYLNPEKRMLLRGSGPQLIQNPERTFVEEISGLVEIKNPVLLGDVWAYKNEEDRSPALLTQQKWLFSGGNCKVLLNERELAYFVQYEPRTDFADKEKYENRPYNEEEESPTTHAVIWALLQVAMRKHDRELNQSGIIAEIEENYSKHRRGLGSRTLQKIFAKANSECNPE